MKHWFCSTLNLTMDSIHNEGIAQFNQEQRESLQKCQDICQSIGHEPDTNREILQFLQGLVSFLHANKVCCPHC